METDRKRFKEILRDVPASRPTVKSTCCVSSQSRRERCDYPRELEQLVEEDQANPRFVLVAADGLSAGPRRKPEDEGVEKERENARKTERRRERERER